MTDSMPVPIWVEEAKKDIAIAIEKGLNPKYKEIFDNFLKNQANQINYEE